jgi:Holliday junction resolvase RusA-like endonuclease
VNFVIEGRLWGLNEYVNACKSRYGQATASRYKRETEEMIGWYIKQGLGNWKANGKVYIKYRWIEANAKRDLDNILSFIMKCTQDSLVLAGVIDNDGWNNIVGISAEFFVDATKPRIEVYLIEKEGETNAGKNDKNKTG